MSAARSGKEHMKRFPLGFPLLFLVAWMSVAWAQEGVTSGTLDEPALLGTYIAGPFTVEEVAMQGFSKEDVCGNTGTFITLTLSVVNDPCDVRSYSFTAYPWRKIPEGAQPVFR